MCLFCCKRLSLSLSKCILLFYIKSKKNPTNKQKRNHKPKPCCFLTISYPLSCHLAGFALFNIFNSIWIISLRNNLIYVEIFLLSIFQLFESKSCNVSCKKNWDSTELSPFYTWAHCEFLVFPGFIEESKMVRSAVKHQGLETQPLDVREPQVSNRQPALWEGGKLTTSTSKAAAQMHWKERISPFSFIFFLMVLNTAEHLFSGGCSQRSLLSFPWENKGRKGCFEECFFFAQRLYIWSNRTTREIKMITNHSNENIFFPHSFLTLSCLLHCFDSFQDYALGLHFRCYFLFWTLPIFLSFNWFL